MKLKSEFTCKNASPKVTSKTTQNTQVYNTKKVVSKEKTFMTDYVLKNWLNVSYIFPIKNIQRQNW